MIFTQYSTSLIVGVSASLLAVNYNILFCIVLNCIVIVCAFSGKKDYVADCVDV